MELSMRSRKELTAVTARRYRKADRGGKSRMLDAFVAATGYNRAYAAMLLRNCGRERVTQTEEGPVRLRATTGHRRAGGRPVKYDRHVRIAAEKLWKRFGRVCGKRLVVILRQTLACLNEHPELKISGASAEALMSISAATLDRLLAPARKRVFLKGLPHTKPVGALCAQIPVRTWSEWKDIGPGHLQVDLVGHDGGVARGEFCFTLATTDICTGWTERRAVFNKASRWVTRALEEIRQVIPFPILELHPDNGSEFINRNLTDYAAQHAIRLSRSRPGRKNDNCYVEQKNFDAVRKLVGYYRYSGQKVVDALNELYRAHSQLQNLVLPSQKLLTRERVGATVRKKHDLPATPADRLLARQDTDGRTRWRVAVTRQDLDPIDLTDRVQRLQREVLALAVRYPESSHSSTGATA